MTNRIFLKAKKHISIGKEFFFEFQDDFSLENQTSQDFLGWEFTVGRLGIKSLDRLFPDNRVVFFPVMGNSPQECLLFENLFYHHPFLKKHTQARHFFIDWPVPCSSLTPRILSSSPTPVVAVRNHSLTVEGAFATNTGDFSQQIHTDPIVFIDSFDSRRHFLSLFFNNNQDTLTCIGGVESLLQWYYLHQNDQPMSASAQREIPTDCLFAGSIIPWLEGLLSQPSLSLTSTAGREFFYQTEKACRRFLRFLKKHPTEPLILTCGPLWLNHLATLLESTPSINELSDVPVWPREMVFQEERDEPYTLQALSHQCTAEHSPYPGFLARDFFGTHATRNSSEKDLISFFSHSFAKAFLAVSERYKDWTKCEINRSQERDFFRFVRRLARQSGQFFPSTFNILLAAVGTVDSNFSFEWLTECRDFPSPTQRSLSSLPTLEISLESLHLPYQHMAIRRFETIRSRMDNSSRRPSLVRSKELSPPHSKKKVEESQYADNSWVNDEHPYSCSFPDEDIFMEKLAANIRRSARERERSRERVVIELQDNFCDGLDLRETIRNWHKEKIMVHERIVTGKADIGTVVFNFAHPSQDTTYSWKSYWLAEQHDDSHLMFYATPFKNNLIGPGIARSEFGGFASIPLPGIAENPWSHPFILEHSSCAADSLILAGALATWHQTLLFISNQTPSPTIVSLLRRNGKSLIHMHLDELSPADIRRVRTFHILAEAGVRDYAQKYIRKE